MESYLKKINDKVKAKHTQQEAEKIKKRYLIAGGTTLGLGLAGFVSAFITFMVLFLVYETDEAMIAWFVAIPFILMIVAGSVVTRIGDMLLRDDKIMEVEKEKKEAKQAIKNKKFEKKLDKLDKSPIIGAIVGDVAGSVYEFNNARTKQFSLFEDDCKFTDDTVMTLAVYQALKDCKGDYTDLSKKTIECMQRIGRQYKHSGYGSSFYRWIFSDDPKAYQSYGNGAAMRISSVALFAKSIEEVKELSHKVTEVSHDHPEGLKGAEATACAIFLARKGKKKDEIKSFIEENYYKLDYDYQNLVDTYTFNETCQETVPQAIYCFLISKDFEDCLRTTISIGGDSDTLAAISCAIAGAYYGVPKKIEDRAISFLDQTLKDILLN